MPGKVYVLKTVDFSFKIVWVITFGSSIFYFGSSIFYSVTDKIILPKLEVFAYI